MAALDGGFWLNRRVMVTGHTGFKGCYLSHWLAEMGADIVGFALEPVMSRPLYDALRLDERIESIVGDVNDLRLLEAVAASRDPEIIIHMAADAIVLSCLKSPVEAFSTNLMGTVNLLQAARRSQDLRAVVVVTSDKCYRPSPMACREDDPLGGDEPYAASKAASEMAVDAFRKCYLQDIDGIGLASARSGNVIGAGDFSANRLLPDLVRGVRSGQPVKLRHPEAVRPWQHVWDALFGYLLLCECLADDPETYGRAWNFGPDHGDERTVGDIADSVCRSLGGSWEHAPLPESVENPTLRLDSSAARKIMNWQSQLSVDETLNWTMSGYRQLLDGEIGWMDRQLADYENRLSRVRPPTKLRPSIEESRHA